MSATGRHCSSRGRLAATALAPLALAACQLLAPEAVHAPAPPAHYLAQDFDRLPDIADEDWRAAWPAWRASCAALAGADAPARDARASAWQGACERAAAIDGNDAAAIRAYLREALDLYRIETSHDEAGVQGGLITGYYEPLLQGSRSADARFSVPLYKVPPDLVRVELAEVVPQLRGQSVRGRLDTSGPSPRVVPYWTRAQIERLEPLHGSELLWVDDPLAAFILQVQGSGRVRLPDGGQIRLSFADSNGQPYRSIGRWLVEHGEMTLEQASLPSIREWARAHPERLAELLDQNPSVVFFRETELGDPDRGPVGALGAVLTPGYSVAVDARFVPLGAPLVIQTVHPISQAVLVRPVLAQDTGGAIRGPLRLDMFWGSGPQAEEAAGRQHGQAALWLLVPKGIRPESLLAR